MHPWQDWEHYRPSWQIAGQNILMWQCNRLQHTVETYTLPLARICRQVWLCGTVFWFQDLSCWCGTYMHGVWSDFERMEMEAAAQLQRRLKGEGERGDRAEEALEVRLLCWRERCSMEGDCDCVSVVDVWGSFFEDQGCSWNWCQTLYLLCVASEWCSGLVCRISTSWLRDSLKVGKIGILQ